MTIYYCLFRAALQQNWIIYCIIDSLYHYIHYIIITVSYKTLYK